MATIFEFEMPTEEVAPHETLIALPNIGSEIERVVTDDPDRITPYVGVRADDFTALEASFDHDPTSDELPLAM